MLAIPLDEKKSTTISKLYGNAPYFGLFDGKKLNVIENEVCGNGPKSAQFLKDKGASSTVYYHMGEGVYKAFARALRMAIAKSDDGILPSSKGNI